MNMLLLLAAKSLLVAGGALLLLSAMRKRSASDRSLIAHLALLTLMLLPVAAVALPALDVVGPTFLVGDSEPVAAPAAPVVSSQVSSAITAAAPAIDAPAAAAVAPSDALAVDWSFWGYALPAALLILLTLIALARLFVLKSRATVLVEPHWLTALARAQQRMGFKHGTALLTSDELPSPISWGVVRPVILLNTAAANSHHEAEAIITHELAHVARLDWAKLMISRIAVALFWFNPLVWFLAREAHQLREEAADDAVLAADIEDTDYARLLVGVARHECRGLLIGAHGVAPGRNSLSRRIKRVLDTATARAPGGWRWSSAAGFFAAGMAVPVAALNLVPPSATASESKSAALTPVGSYYPETQEKAAAPIAGLPEIVVSATTAAVQGAVESTDGGLPNGATVMTSPNGASITSRNGQTVMRGPDGATITVHAPNPKGLQRVVMRGPDGAVMEFADARAVPGLPAFAIAGAAAHPHPSPKVKTKSAIDRAIEMKALGVTPEYIASLRAAAPQLRDNLDHDDIVEMRAVGVSAEYIRELASAGLRGLDKDSLVAARALGITPNYVRGLSGAGYPNLNLDQLTELRAVGVTPRYIQQLRQAGYGRISVDKLVQMRAIGVSARDLNPNPRPDPDPNPDPDPDPR